MPLHAQLNRLFFAFLVLFLLAFAHAQEAPKFSYLPIETFSSYSIDIKILEKGTAEITHHITIKNNESTNPIVPGIAYLNVFKDQERNYKIRDLDAKLADGSPIVKFIREEKDFFEIRYELWFPLAPKKTTTILVSYKIDNFYPESQFFSEISFPIGDSSIPIEKAQITLYPSGKRVSFAEGAKDSKDALQWNLGSIEVGQVKKISFEFTSLPFPRLPIKGFIIFWGGITLLGLALIAFLAIVIRRFRRGRGLR